MSAQDELVASICLAVRQLTQMKKAGYLLNTVLALIEDGHYGEDVEAYLNFCLQTPDLPKEDMEKVLLAHSNAQKLGGSQLQLGHVWSVPPRKESHFSIESACQRIPPEIWDQIAAQMPVYHLRTWLFLSLLHREVASRHIFHKVDIYFREFDGFDRGLDILDRAISDPVFASRVKSLRLHWEYKEGDVLDLILRILKIALPTFKALQNFEWIGNFEMPVEMVKILDTCEHRGLGLIGRHFGRAQSFGNHAIVAFHNLRKFSFGVTEDNEGSNLGTIRAILDCNENTLKHLILRGGSDLHESLDLVFGSVTINNLTHLDIFDTVVSSFMIDRISHANNLQSLTLDGLFADLNFVSEMFVTDRIIDGRHTFLPHLESFRLFMEDENEGLSHSVIHSLQKREKLRRLDLRSCPWKMVQNLLPDLKNLRVLAVSIEFSHEAIKSLVKAIPMQMVAIRLSGALPDTPLEEYAQYFTCFNTLSFLLFELSTFPAKADRMPENTCRMQMRKSLRSIAATVPSLDFLAYHCEYHWRDFVVVRSHGDTGPTVELEGLSTRSNSEYGSGVDVVSKDIAWLQEKDTLIEF